MTTRKALIEKIQSMQLGTQEMLDAAADDATLIPFDTLFWYEEERAAAWRPSKDRLGFSDKRSAAFAVEGKEWEYLDASCLSPMP